MMYDNKDDISIVKYEVRDATIQQPLTRGYQNNSSLQAWVIAEKYIIESENKNNTAAANVSSNKSTNSFKHNNNSNLFLNVLKQYKPEIKCATHNLFNGGQYSIPDEMLETFYQKYSEDVSNDLQNINCESTTTYQVQHSLSENGYKNQFAIFADLDLVFLRGPTRFDQDSICLIAQIIQKATKKFYQFSTYPELQDEWWQENGLMIVTQNISSPLQSLNVDDDNNSEQKHLSNRNDNKTETIFNIGLVPVKNHNPRYITIQAWDNSNLHQDKCEYKGGVHIYFPKLIVNSEQIKFIHQSWIYDLDKYLSYNDYFCNNSMLKLNINPNNFSTSLESWSKIVDFAVYNSTPHLRMVYSHKIKHCTFCKHGKQVATANNISKNNTMSSQFTCTVCKNTGKIGAGYNAIHMPVYILDGFGNPTKEHLDCTITKYKVFFDSEKIKFVDGQKIYVHKPMRRDLQNKYQGLKRVKFINMIVNYCKIRIPLKQASVNKYFVVLENNYIDAENLNKTEYILMQTDNVNKKLKKKSKNMIDLKNKKTITTTTIDNNNEQNDNNNGGEKNVVIKKNVNIATWPLLNNCELTEAINADINMHCQEWEDIKILYVRKSPNENVYIINVDTKYAKFCQNVQRFHHSSNIFFVLNSYGISQRCFSQNNFVDQTLEMKCKNFRGIPFAYQQVYLSLFNDKTLCFSNYELYHKQFVINKHIKNLSTNKQQNLIQKDDVKKNTKQEESLFKKVKILTAKKLKLEEGEEEEGEREEEE